jgi:hypothetical protein
MPTGESDSRNSRKNLLARQLTYDALDGLLTAVAIGGDGGAYNWGPLGYDALGNIISFPGLGTYI